MGIQQMQGESVRRGSVLGEHLRRPCVGERPFVGPHRFVGGDPEDRVGKVEFERRSQDGRGPQSVGDVGRVFEIQLGKWREVSQRAAPAQNGERTNEGVRPFREHGQPPRELAGDALGAEMGYPARGLVVRFSAGGDQGRDERVQEQRVSAGRSMAGAAETVGCGIEVGADKARRRTGSQRRRPDRLTGRERADLADEFGVSGRITASHRDDDQHPQPVEARPEVGEEPE